MSSSHDAKRSGLLMDSVMMADNLATVAFGEIDRVIGRFSQMGSVDSALRARFSLYEWANESAVASLRSAILTFAARSALSQIPQIPKFRDCL